MLSDREQGSSLLLMPVAVLVLVVLGAICVDLSAVHLGQRELLVATQGAANDAAAAGFDAGRFYADGVVRLDRSAAHRAAVSSLAANAPGARMVALVVDDSAAAVAVRASAPVTPVFAPAVPGGPGIVTVTAHARAELEG